MMSAYLYPDTSHHLMAYNSIIDQPVMFLEARFRPALKARTFGLLYGANTLTPAGAWYNIESKKLDEIQ